MKFKLTFLLLSFISKFVFSHYFNPSDHFSGAQHRPKLEIIYPDNGQILDNGDLEIRIKVDGYDMPSSFYESTICIGLSTSVKFAEQCFEQTAELVFHANGLSPGSQYALRIVLYERSRAIAVSVRNFRVAGIRGLLNSDEIVTIQTAVQVAMEYQTMGMEAQAELIYRSILSESPTYPDALHLLGVIFYQKGDVQAAIPYIERALQSNKSFEGFHNSLGVCYRTMGRTEEAEIQFQLAIALNPNYMSAVFNLGLTYQQMGRWDLAIAQYHTVNEVSRVQIDAVKPQVRLESKIRECDLMQGQLRVAEALRCWEDGIDLFPTDGVIRNEIGSMYAKANMLEEAAAHLEVSISEGYSLAELNLARVREMQGYPEQARDMFLRAKAAAEAQGLPSYHIAVSLATVQPKVFASPQHLMEHRAALSDSLRALLDSSHAQIDNIAPTSFGFWTGYHLLFHGEASNAALKSQLYQVYRVMCPALLQGRFLEQLDTQSWEGEERQDTTYDEQSAVTLIIADKNKETITSAGEASDFATLTSFAALQETTASEPHCTAGDLMAWAATKGDGGGDVAGPISGVNDTVNELSSATQFTGEAHSPDSVTTLRTTSSSSAAAQMSKTVSRLPGDKIRVGFVSRFLYEHPVGSITVGLVDLLSREFEVVTFLIGAGTDTDKYDSIQKRLVDVASTVVRLPVDDIESCVRSLRAERLDVLVFPELGIDLTTYFVAFSRVAPVQVAWLGHPDTTGVQSIDYFVSSDVEVSTAQSRYSERLQLMRGFGTAFHDSELHQRALKVQLHSPRSVLLHRAKFIESQVNIPKSAHLYFIPGTATRLHSSFDEVVRKILQQDSAAVLIVAHEEQILWNLKELYMDRVMEGLVGDKREELARRVLFAHTRMEADMFNMLLISHVMLDPFPGTEDCTAALQALSVGLPVVTMPSQRLSGRFTLGLYRMLNYGFHDSNQTEAADAEAAWGEVPTREAQLESGPAGDRESTSALVVHTVHDYLTMALRLTHQPKLRTQHSLNILSRRQRLFGPQRAEQALEDWRAFIHGALHNSTLP